jgi:hypothetical protein
MRLKLVFIASLLAAIVGAGSSIVVILFLFSNLQALRSPTLVVWATFALPLVTCLLASIFVYRHTARRRRLQAVLTAILSILFSLAAFAVASIVTARVAPLKPEPLEQRPVA